jgi:hypothetical protein
MIDNVEKQIYEVVSKFAFIEKAETLLKTPNRVMSSLFCKFSQSLYSQRFPLVPLKRRSFAF